MLIILSFTTWIILPNDSSFIGIAHTLTVRIEGIEDNDIVTVNALRPPLGNTLNRRYVLHRYPQTFWSEQFALMRTSWRCIEVSNIHCYGHIVSTMHVVRLWRNCIGLAICIGPSRPRLFKSRIYIAAQLRNILNENNPRFSSSGFEQVMDLLRLIILRPNIYVMLQTH